MKKLLWTPEFRTRSYEVVISLDWDFAREMFRSKIPMDVQDKFNRMVAEELRERGTNEGSPCSFAGQSALITQIYFGNGVFLAARRDELDNLERGNKPDSGVVVFRSEDATTPRLSSNLLYCFGKWVDYRDIIRGRTGD